jgi:hypothetical protein
VKKVLLTSAAVVAMFAGAANAQVPYVPGPITGPRELLSTFADEPGRSLQHPETAGLALGANRNELHSNVVGETDNEKAHEAARDRSNVDRNARTSEGG